MSAAVTRAARAVRLEGAPPRIDGAPDEAVWQSAPILGDFVQFEPSEGAAPTHPTELRILYGSDALYIAAWMYDSAPDSIEGQLTRRDQGSYSDLIIVAIDSYLDRRTAFEFHLNPRGVKADLYRFDDSRQDMGWDAVWEGAARITEGGWTAEFRIPFSQLRYALPPDGGEMTWGFNAMRSVARTNETSVWAPMSRQSPQIVSRFGLLSGLSGIAPLRRLEAAPYLVARGARVAGDAANPFWNPTQTEFEAGGDARYGLTGNLTLNLTVNPDFGQVEADPSQVNLTAFETFLPERRPFFVEGANIFNVRLGQGDEGRSSEALFYSRRIGRAPQGRADAQGGWADQVANTRILAAGKISGKTERGLSIGVLHALTAREEASVLTGAGERLSPVVEPRAQYLVGRVQQDFRGGQSAVGLVSTGVLRDGEDAALLGIRSSAWTGGLDGRHIWGGRQYQATVSLLGSHIRGSEAAILTAQRAPARYFQRPDADHLELDPTRTSMEGWAAAWEAGRIAGSPWRFSTGGRARSPGFEANDLGFLQEADAWTQWVGGSYQRTVPGRWTRGWGVNLNASTSGTFGGEGTGRGLNLNGNVQLQNFWSTFGGVGRDFGGVATGALRGGPALLREAGWNGWGGINSDQRRAVQGSLFQNWSVRPESDSWNYGATLNLRWRPSGRITTSVAPSWNRQVEDRQWITRISTPVAGGGTLPHYLVGRLEQSTVSLTTRVDVAFTPDLTLQLYAAPFVASGSYADFRSVTNPQAPRYEDRFRSVPARRVDDAARYEADLDGNGVAERWSDPDFSTRQFRSTAVLRWEYRPGSALFLVWGQSRSGFDRDGTFDWTGGTEALFRTRPDNVLMVKGSWWMAP